MQQLLFENALVVLLLPAAYYILWRLFRKTWQALDQEAHAWNPARIGKGISDLRPWAVFL